MRKRHEGLSFGGKEWACVSAQSPLGLVTMARRLPTAGRRAPTKSENVSDEIIRRFEPSSQPGSVVLRLRVRRSL